MHKFTQAKLCVPFILALFAKKVPPKQVYHHHHFRNKIYSKQLTPSHCLSQMAKVGAKFWQSKDPLAAESTLSCCCWLRKQEPHLIRNGTGWTKRSALFVCRCVLAQRLFDRARIALGPLTECLARLTVSGLGRADSAAFASDSAGSVRLKYISSAFSASFGFRSLNNNGGEDPWKKEAQRITHTLRLFCTWRLWARTRSLEGRQHRVH